MLICKIIECTSEANCSTNKFFHTNVSLPKQLALYTYPFNKLKYYSLKPKYQTSIHNLQREIRQIKKSYIINRFINLKHCDRMRISNNILRGTILVEISRGPTKIDCT